MIYWQSRIERADKRAKAPPLKRDSKQKRGVAGGKQYKVAEGDTIYIEKMEVNDGDAVKFDNVLVVEKDGNVTVGAPYVEGASVSGKVVKNGKSKKITVFKFKAKKNYRRRQGHRQPYTKVTIEKIEA